LNKLIFVTLGTHPQNFDRLLKEVDLLVEKGKIKEKVFCQIGHSSYKPKSEFARFLTLDEFNKKLSEANIVITHAGEGNIGLCKNLGKKMIVIPRRKEFGEHTNDHQLELAEVVEQKKLGLVAWDVKELGKKLEELKYFTPKKVARGKINELLEKFYNEELK
tara:strand:- start:781 stop:1266 length:486 start_codon:yes stop_codon:yes gene_type:complete